MKIRTALSRPCPARQTDNGQLFFLKSGENPDSGQNRDRKNPDRQTSDSIFYKILDSILCKNPVRIRSADRHRTGFFWKIRTKTRPGQDTDSAVRRHLAQTRTQTKRNQHTCGAENLFFQINLIDLECNPIRFISFSSFCISDG